MLDKVAFSDEEWLSIVGAPAMAGVAISKLDMGVVSFAKELSAMIKAIAAAREEYPSNPLVQAVVAEYADKTGEALPDFGSKTPDEILVALGQVGAIVDTRASAEEARGFKRFLFGVSERVANASGSGFFGTGAKVSEDEQRFLQRMREALGL